MNFVLARVKRLSKQPFFKIMSDYTLFDEVEVDLISQIVYSPDHNLDEDSWFKLEQFSQQDFCLDILKNDIDSKVYSDLTSDRFGSLSCLLAVQNNNTYFQKITPSLFIKRKYLAFGDVAVIEDSKQRLVINEYPDAIYFKAEDTLVFKNLATISSIFKGIDRLYKEATKLEVEQFLSNSFIKLKDSFCVDKVTKPNRRRIGLAMDTLAKMGMEERKATLHYINDYCSHDLKYDSASGTIEISNNEDLKKLLYGIEQRFFTTQISKEKRIANSVIPI